MRINGKIFSGMCISAANSLDNSKTLINNLNVFPVPDGDTGINMSLTMGTSKALDGFDGTISECSERIADLILRSARGNSGAILSLFFRGLARALKGLDSAGVADFANAFAAGTNEAYRAVANPAEGTILTIMRVCSEKANEAVGKGEFEGDIIVFFAFLKKIAEETLAITPYMLPILKEAGVVDAGGRGFVAVIDGMYEALKGNPVERLGGDDDADIQSSGSADFGEFDTGDIRFAYCTECIVDKKTEKFGENTANNFREFLLGIGDSLVFIDAEKFIKLHVHTNNPGLVLERAIEYGSLSTVKVENMRNQHSELAGGVKAESVREPYGFVAVCLGSGIESAFRDLGVNEIVSGGQTMNPCTDDLYRAINNVNSEVVYVLVNNKNIKMVAEQAAEMIKDKQVHVIPTAHFTEGVAAMLAFDADSTPDENLKAMKSAAGNVKTISTTKSVRSTSIGDMVIEEGETLGLLGGKVASVGKSSTECIEALVDNIGGARFVSIYIGEDAEESTAAAVESLISDRVPGAEVMTVDGGQPLFDFVISAE